MAICQAHKLPKTHLESVTGKGNRSALIMCTLKAHIFRAQAQCTDYLLELTPGKAVQQGPAVSSKCDAETVILVPVCRTLRTPAASGFPNLLDSNSDFTQRHCCSL